MKSTGIWSIAAIACGCALIGFGVWWPGAGSPGASRSAISDRAGTNGPLADTLSFKPDESMRSVWFAEERERYSRLLQSHPCDTLVVPVQSQHFGFDRATRSILGAQLALAIAADKSRCVVDPYLASRALGEGMRRYEESDVIDLARKVNAQTIVWTYVGHDDHSTMEIYMRVERANVMPGTSVRPARPPHLARVSFGDELPPFVAWRDALPEALAALALPVPATPQSSSAAQPELEPELPASPSDLSSKLSDDPLDPARRYQLLAALGPQVEFRAVEQLYEKAWLAASLAPESAESRQIRARALLHLGYRPAGLALLTGDDSAQGKLLRALLDGNLPEAETSAKDTRAPVQQVIAELEARDLRATYGRMNWGEEIPATLRDARLRSPAWDTVLRERSADLNDWHPADNIDIKAMLDRLYPIDGYSLEDIERGSAVAGLMPSEEQRQLLPFRHIVRLLAQQPERFCCASMATGPGSLDFLMLISARAQATLEKRFNHQAWIQGRQQKALELLNTYDEVFAGHPHFSSLRASALIELFIHGNDGQEAVHKQAAFAAARSGVFWEQAGTEYSWTSLRTFGIPSTEAARFSGAYDRDLPPKPNWAPAVAALRYSSAFPTAVLLPPLNSTTDNAVSDEIKSRFHGSKQAANAVASFADRSDGAADVAVLRARVEGDPGDWAGYAKLADALVSSGDYADAVKSVRQYPGFKAGSGENTVALSNYAVAVASSIFWHGDIESSKALYELAAGYDNGSDSSMLAAERLRLIAADYPGAAALAFARMQRYESPYAFRDYLQLLFAHGDAKDGWAAFRQAAGRIDIPEFWFAAIVGHRIEGAAPQVMGDWLLRDSVRTIRVEQESPAVRAGMLFFAIDRAPYPELPSLLTRVAGAPETKIDAGEMNLLRPVPGKETFTPIARSAFRRDERSGKEGDLVPSPYVLLAPAYEAVRGRDYVAAVNAFAAFANFYAIEGDRWDPMMDFGLPYFAYAAANSGDTLKLQAFLDTQPKQSRRFAFHLAKAYFTGLDGRADEALDHLRSAFAAKPLDSGTNMATDYQYAESCVWLFEATHDRRYLELALDWARSYQVMEPTMAWAYALEARYGDPKDKRHLHAVEMALYLDRNSNWLSGVPKVDIERARAALAKSNPFRIPSKSKQNEI